MTQKEVELYGSKMCKLCGKKMEANTKAFANTDERPWTFQHIECTKKEGTTDDFKEMVLAILSDHSQDLILVKQLLRSIYEKEFPGTAGTKPTVSDVMGGKS